MSAIERPPFDAIDAEHAERYARRRGFALFDLLPDRKPTDDVLFEFSLSGARTLIADRFGLEREDGRAFRAYPFLVSRPSANAFAAEDAGLQLCGVEVGLCTAAFEIGMFVFSQSSLFREIGDPDAEASPTLPDGSQLAFWTADRLRRRGTADGPPIGQEFIPRDPQRQVASQILTQLQLRFVWLHELYHGVNGHTGLLASLRPAAVLNDMPDEGAVGLVEIEPAEAAEGEERLRHAMEYDADRSAFWMLLRLQQADLEAIPELLARPKAFRLKLTIFAAVMMTFVFDQAARRQARRSGATHPKAQHRLVDLVRTLASHLLEPPEEMKQAFLAVLAEMNALQAVLPQFVSASRLWDDLHSAQLQRELDEVDDALGATRARFAPFAYRAAIRPK